MNARIPHERWGSEERRHYRIQLLITTSIVTDARFENTRKGVKIVSPQRTEMLTHDEQRIWEVKANEEATCRSCGRELRPGEMVTMGIIAVSPRGLVCKFCRPFDLFWVPKMPDTQYLDKITIGDRYEVEAVRHHDGTPYLQLHNRQGGWYQVWIAPEEAGDLAAALMEMATALTEARP